MADNGSITVALSHLNGFQSLGEGANLINLHQDGVGATLFYAAMQIFNVGNEQVVAHELDTASETLGEQTPAFPVVFGHTVFNRVDGIFVHQLLEVVNLLFGSENLAVGLFPGVVVFAVFEELACSAVQADGDLFSGFVAGSHDSVDDSREGVVSALQRGSEAAFVANAGAQTALFKHFLEGVEHLRTPAYSLREAACANRTNHELLETDGSVGVSAAIDDVHHRHGKNVAVRAAYIFIQGKVEIIGSGFSHSEADTQDGVCAEFRFGVCAVQLTHSAVNGNLVEGVHALQSLCYGSVDVGNGFLHAFALIAVLVAVAKLKGFVDACGSSRRNCCTAKSARFQCYVYFYGRIASRIKYFATYDFFNLHLMCVFKSFTFYNLFFRAQNYYFFLNLDVGF